MTDEKHVQGRPPTDESLMERFKTTRSTEAAREIVSRHWD